MGPECEWHRRPYLRFREQHLSTWYVWPGCLRRLSRHPTTTITPNRTKKREHHAFLSQAISCVRPSTRTNTPSSPTNRLPRPILADPDQYTVVLLTESDPPFTRSSLHTAIQERPTCDRTLDHKDVPPTLLPRTLLTANNPLQRAPVATQP